MNVEMNRMNVLTGFLLLTLLFSGCSGIEKEEKAGEMDDSGYGYEDGEEQEESEDPDYEMKIINMKQEEQEEIADRLLTVVDKCRDIYGQAIGKDEEDVRLDDAAIHRMIDMLASGGYQVTCGDHDYNMQNYEKVNEELLRAKEGNEAETEFYSINAGGVFSYHHLQFRDKEMIVTYVSAMFDDSMEPYINYMDKVQVYQWEYTKKGWLIWEKALSRNQEMDMHVLYRILPLEDKCREIAEKSIIPVSYMSNNLFLTDWDMDKLDQIGFNDLFDYLYVMERGEPLDAAAYSDGIPQEEFESIVQKYFDISAKELREYADYDEEKGVYPWYAIGPWNRIRQFQSFPEVVKCVENEDGTLLVYVEAVFKELGMDCYFRHIVTIREEEDGRWVYCGNKVDWERSYNVPGYKARREYENI